MGGMTQHWHRAGDEGQQTQPNDRLFADWSSCPVFAFDDEEITVVVLGVLSAGGDICGECYELGSCGGSVAPLFKSCCDAVFEPLAMARPASGCFSGWISWLFGGGFSGVLVTSTINSVGVG